MTGRAPPYWSPDSLVLNDDWSDLRQRLQMPKIDRDRLLAYRASRLRLALRDAGAALCVLVNPISLRYAIDYRNYALFQSHIPTTYLFFSVDGPPRIHGAYDPQAQSRQPARPLSYFDGGPALAEGSRLLADDIVNYLREIGTDNRRVALESANPSLTHALLRRGLEVIDGAAVSERARAIKSADEIACIRWSIAVAEHGIAKIKEALRPGVSEQQLWALLNYVNIANDGDWHDGRMLASGPRTNPWCQEASSRRVEAGDLVAFDTDMIGPFGYCADISRTFHCGPRRPSKRQKQLYRLALEEIEHNLRLVRPGISFSEFQQQAFVIPEEFRQNAYPCLIHGVGMCDEYPRVNPAFRGSNPYDGALETGMVICVESYMGAAGQSEGVKLEQQILVTENGYETLSRYPFEDALLA